MLLLDTSVIVAFYIPEAKSSKAQRLFSSETQLALCPLAEVEFHSAIARLVRMKMINRDAGQKVLEMFQSHVSQKFYKPLAITRKEYDLARDWLSSFKTSLRTLDALHLAVADTNGVAFITADKGLAKAAAKLSVAVKTL